MPRKTRIVKGGFIDLNDVKCGPGDNYINWKCQTLIKLQERERKSFQQKIKQIEEICNTQSRNFGVNNQAIYNGTYQDGEQSVFIIKQKFEQWMKHLFHELNSWKGVRSDRIRTPITNFADYCKKGKNWWDQRKLHIYKKIIFPDLFGIIYNFVHNHKQNGVHFNLYLLNILKDIFDGTISYPSTKPLSLIPAGCLRFKGTMNETQQFLFNKVSKSFGFEFWQKQKKDNNKQRTQILKKIQNKLHELIHSAQQSLTNNTKEMASNSSISSISSISSTPTISMNNNEIQAPSLNINITSYPISSNLTAYAIHCHSSNFNANILVNHDYNISRSPYTQSSDIRWNPLS